MLYKRKGLPEVDEIVLCKVTKIFPNSVFVDLLEFNDSGMVHISEVSPGRIRNLRDYVSVGRQIVCKVLKIDRDRGHIDLSLRRVNTHQRREKLDEIKQELKAESLVQNLSKKLNLPKVKLYQQITEKIFKEYSHLYLCFWDVVSGEVNLEKMGLEKKLAQELQQAILDKFKPEKIFIQGTIHLKTYASNGLEKIKESLKSIEDISKTISVSYLGAGKYKLIIEDTDYGPAEETLEEIEDFLEEFNDKISTASFAREKND